LVRAKRKQVFAHKKNYLKLEFTSFKANFWSWPKMCVVLSSLSSQLFETT